MCCIFLVGERCRSKEMIRNKFSKVNVKRQVERGVYYNEMCENCEYIKEGRDAKVFSSKSKESGYMSSGVAETIFGSN